MIQGFSVFVVFSLFRRTQWLQRIHRPARPPERPSAGGGGYLKQPPLGKHLGICTHLLFLTILWVTLSPSPFLFPKQ